MQSIQPVTEHNWHEDKFSGELLNKSKESDLGVNFQLYEEEVEKGAKEQDCTRVSQPGPLGLLNDQKNQHLQDSLNYLYLQPQDMNTLRQITIVCKELRENDALRTSINSQAAKVLIIRKNISTSTVHQSINAIIAPHFWNDLLALRLVQSTHGEMYFGEPSDRKKTFIERI
jgi:hypothetical protein